MTPLDEHDPEYVPQRQPYARQLIVESLPKSTMIVGAALWTLLFALGSCQMSMTSDIKKAQAEQAISIAVMSSKADGYNRDMDALKGQVKAIDDRLRSMEDRQLRVVPR